MYAFPSLKLTVRTWKWMAGSWKMKFPLGMACFQVLCHASLRECKWIWKKQKKTPTPSKTMSCVHMFLNTCFGRFFYIYLREISRDNQYHPREPATLGLKKKQATPSVRRMPSFGSVSVLDIALHPLPLQGYQMYPRVKNILLKHRWQTAHTHTHICYMWLFCSNKFYSNLSCINMYIIM